VRDSRSDAGVVNILALLRVRHRLRRIRCSTHVTKEFEDLRYVRIAADFTVHARTLRGARSISLFIKIKLFIKILK